MSDIYISEITKNNLKVTEQINYLLNILSSNFKGLSVKNIDLLINKKNIIILELSINPISSVY